MRAQTTDDDLVRLERALAERDAAAVEGGLSALLDDDFVEFGASGRVWDRPSTLSMLGASPARTVQILDPIVRRLGPDVALLTYRIAGEAPSLRSSLWVRRDGRWRIVFHQGTPTEPGR